MDQTFRLILIDIPVLSENGADVSLPGPTRVRTVDPPPVFPLSKIIPSVTSRLSTGLDYD